RDVTYGSGGFVAVRPYSHVLFSSNAVDWTDSILGDTLTNPPPPFPGFIFPMEHWKVTYAYGHFVIASSRYASSGSADPFMFVSTNGVQWTTNDLGNVFTGSGGFAWYAFAVGNGTVLTAGRANFINYFIYQTTDFTNWSTLTGKPASGAQTLAGSFGNGN